ncbi:MAG TPA: GNAT family N-acetyltransferase [Nocardioidaceae bacterium]
MVNQSHDLGVGEGIRSPSPRSGSADLRPTRVAIRRTPDDEWAAASIWAAATARRDDLPSPVPAETKLRGIQQTLMLAGASLHLAWRGSNPCGFAVLLPTGTSLEIRYLAVASDAWGTGVGLDLLSHVLEHARVNGFATIDLWVIDTNTRAIGLYERGGWLRTDDLKSQIETRRIERRFVHRVRGEANPC